MSYGNTQNNQAGARPITKDPFIAPPLRRKLSLPLQNIEPDLHSDSSF